MHGELFEAAERDEALEVEIDLPRQILRLPSGREAQFPIDEFSKKCLLAGVDQLGYLQQQSAVVAEYEAGHPRPVATL